MALTRGAALDYLSERFGGIVDAAESVVVAGVAAVQLVGNDPDRMAVTIVNLSANTVYVSLANDVSASKGIVLNANGGTATLTLDEDMILVTRELWALASAAASNVYVQTVRRATLA